MKIEYGIDLGTTNSAIARIDAGAIRILKSDTQKDTVPSCVSFGKNGAVRVGDTAFSRLKNDRLKAMKTWSKEDANVFVEFKRAMGTDKRYQTKNTDATWSPEALSAEVLKALKAFASDQEIRSVVVTVPALFTVNQNDATRRAANLAGFSQVELLQEPVAASMAYGIGSAMKDARWLVFDFGGGTFDAALVEVNEGIIKVIDTEGSNHLGGTNLDYAIVDHIILPEMAKTNAIESILADENKKRIFRDAMKCYAEELKIQLSFTDTYNLVPDLGEIPGEDDDGEEFELDLNVDQTMMKDAVAPVFQQAIDLCKELLRRNGNLVGNDLTSVLLVGGPTYSPVLRAMVKEQITKQVDTSVDPMTVVARGAALYASTIDVSSQVQDATRDKSKVQLELKYEATTVENEEFVTVKLLDNQETDLVPEEVSVEVVRGDKGWSSGRVVIDEVGDVVEVILLEGQPTQFEIHGFDGQGNRLEVEPSELTIIQGTQIGASTMPYHFGIEVYSRKREQLEFVPIPGLEKNKQLPAKGIIADLKTSKDVRPGNAEDVIKIPLYQGEHHAEGSRAVYNEHVYDIHFTGDHFPVLVPSGTDLELTVEISRDQDVVCRVFIPAIDHDEEVPVPKDQVQKVITAEQLDTETSKAEHALELLREQDTSDNLKGVDEVSSRLGQVKTELDEGRADDDRRMQVRGNLRKVLREIDRLTADSEWPKTESELTSVLYQLEETQKKSDETTQSVPIQEFRTQVEKVIAARDVESAKKLIDTMRTAQYELLSGFVDFWLGFLKNLYDTFDDQSWTDRRQAQELIRQGMRVANENPSVRTVRPIVGELLALLPDGERLREEAGGTVSR